VACFLVAALAVRFSLTRAFQPGLLAFPLAIPLVTLAWVALDNIVFLFLPVRYMPGQDGALQHSGRLVVSLFLRLLLLLVASLVVGLAVALTLFLGNQFDLAPLAQWIALAAAGSLALGLVDALLVAAGGHMLARFDVARDRP
jgi:hypothetical protein